VGSVGVSLIPTAYPLTRLDNLVGSRRLVLRARRVTTMTVRNRRGDRVDLQIARR